MNKNIIIMVLIGFIIIFTGCVEEKVTSTEIPDKTASPSPTSTVAETPIIEVTSTPEPSETWPKYIMRYNYYDGKLEYQIANRLRKIEISEVLSTCSWPNGTLDVVYSDFRIVSYKNATMNIRGYHKATQELSRETYESYEKILAEKEYVLVSLHTIHEPIPIVIDDSIQKIMDFLIEDTTNEMVYTQQENKKYIYFTKQLSKNASEHNLSIGVILLGNMGFIAQEDNYALNYFYLNDQLYFIDPVTDEIITVCETFDYGYLYGKLYPDESMLTIYRGSQKIKHDINLGEICKEHRGFI